MNAPAVDLTTQIDDLFGHFRKYNESQKISPSVNRLGGVGLGPVDEGGGLGVDAGVSGQGAAAAPRDDAAERVWMEIK